MKTLRAHFDGKVLVPDEPVDLPVGEPLEVKVRRSPVEATVEDRPLLRLAEALKGLPSDPDSPTDGAAQHDHYLYGTPKRP